MLKFRTVNSQKQQPQQLNWRLSFWRAEQIVPSVSSVSVLFCRKHKDNWPTKCKSSESCMLHVGWKWNEMNERKEWSGKSSVGRAGRTIPRCVRRIYSHKVRNNNDLIVDDHDDCIALLCYDSLQVISTGHWTVFLLANDWDVIRISFGFLPPTILHPITSTVNSKISEISQIFFS